MGKADMKDRTGPGRAAMGALFTVLLAILATLPVAA